MESHTIQTIFLRPSVDLVIEQVVDIHRAEIPGGFLSKLPRKFLFKIYKTVVFSKHADLIVAINGDVVGGFIAISYDTKRFYKDFCFRYLLYSLCLVMLKLFSWKAICRMFETFKHGSKKNHEDGYGRCGEILNFCVSFKSQRSGIGKKLFFESVNLMKSRNIHTIEIITGNDQVSAQEFYKKIGAEFIKYTQVHKGEESSLFYYYTDLV